MDQQGYGDMKDN